MMSASNTSNNSLHREVISDEIQVITFCEVGLSILTVIANLINFYWIRKTFVTTLVYQIQQVDSLVSAVCQIGYIGILLSSISDAPNAYICCLATTLFFISVFHFLLLNGSAYFYLGCIYI